MEIGAGEIGVIVFTIVIIIVSIAAAIIPVVLILKFLGNMSGQRQQLLATGIPAQARVVQLGMTGTTINDNPLLQIVLEVQAGQSPGYRGGPTSFVASTQMLVPMIAMPRVQPGSVVPVRYSPTNPQEITIDFRSMGFM